VGGGRGSNTIEGNTTTETGNGNAGQSAASHVYYKKSYLSKQGFAVTYQKTKNTPDFLTKGKNQGNQDCNRSSTRMGDWKHRMNLNIMPRGQAP